MFKFNYIQTYKNWKVYLIDDNSNDNSKEILKKYQKFDNIKIFFLKKIKAQLIVEILVLKNQIQSLLAFMDSDDFWPKDKLEKQLFEYVKK